MRGNKPLSTSSSRIHENRTQPHSPVFKIQQIQQPATKHPPLSKPEISKSIESTPLQQNTPPIANTRTSQHYQLTSL
ncbi:hypothetical protein JCM33374_g5012 [Metschnikowia sp. JCM 33374]|nr:hypothetical protein JCM33374_g5012 [Metschnikowia sp. JCM 33374]